MQILDLMLLPAHAVEYGKEETAIVIQRIDLYYQWRYSRDLRLNQNQGKLMFFNNLLSNLALRAIKLTTYLLRSSSINW